MDGSGDGGGGPGRPPSTAGTVVCEGCGGAVALGSLDETVTCPWCGRAQRVDPEVLARLSRYLEEVRGRIARAEEEKAQSALYDRYYGKGGKAFAWKPQLAAVALFIGVPLSIAFGFVGLVKSGALPESAMRVMPIPMTGAIVLMYVLYFAWYFSGRRKGGRVAVAAQAVVCPRCGAAGSLAAGSASGTCAFCGAALVPTGTVMRQGVEDARRAWRAARMERFRKEREAMRTMAGWSAGSWTPYLIIGSFGFMTGAGSVIFSILMLTGREKRSPAIFVMWGITLALAAIAAGIALVRRARRERWAGALGALAASLRGETSPGLEGLVGWLNAYWAGPYPPASLLPGLYGASLRFVCRGFPACLYVDPVGVSDQYKPKIHLFLAAWVPGLSDGEGGEARLEGAAGDAARALRDAGFEVEVQEAGIRTAAPEGTVGAVRRDPHRGAPALVPVFDAMARLAAALGASPGPVIP